jgi:hypothetical protein
MREYLLTIFDLAIQRCRPRLGGDGLVAVDHGHARPSPSFEWDATICFWLLLIRFSGSDLLWSVNFFRSDLPLPCPALGSHRPRWQVLGYKELDLDVHLGARSREICLNLHLCNNNKNQFRKCKFELPSAKSSAR